MNWILQKARFYQMQVRVQIKVKSHYCITSALLQHLALLQQPMDCFYKGCEKGQCSLQWYVRAFQLRLFAVPVVCKSSKNCFAIFITLKNHPCTNPNFEVAKKTMTILSRLPTVYRGSNLINLAVQDVCV